MEFNMTIDQMSKMAKEIREAMEKDYGHMFLGDVSDYTLCHYWTQDYVAKHDLERKCDQLYDYLMSQGIDGVEVVE